MSDDTSLFDAADDVFSEEEFADAQKPYEIFPEGDYAIRVESAGDDENDTAVVKPNSIQVELVLEATNAQGGTTTVYHNQTIALRANNPKKRKKVKAMAARFYAALGFSAAEARQTHRALLAREPNAATILVDRTGRALLGVGKTNKGKDRNEVIKFILPNGASSSPSASAPAQAPKPAAELF